MIRSYIVDNDEVFKRQLERLGELTSDFRIPFYLIANDFYKSNRKLFTLQSKGLYQDLAPAQGEDGNPTTKTDYKKRKQREVGFVYPILVKSGRLANSLLDRNAPGADFFIDETSLIMGTTVSYAKYHQSDAPRSRIPQRKVVFIDGGPAEKARDASIAGRRERWGSIIFDHIQQLITREALP